MQETKVKLFTPSKPQKEALRVIHIDKPFITLLKYGRQCGKSFLFLMDMITRCLNEPRLRVRFVVPAYSLATKHMMTIDNLFSNHQELKNSIFKGIKYKEQTYTFHNGSIAMFLSAEAGDNLRGDTCDFLYIDEAAFMQEAFYTEVLLPMLTRTGGRVAMASTPNGKNWFYDLYKKGLEDNPLVKTLEATYLDLKDEPDYEDVLRVIESLRSTMTNSAFEREVMAEFVSDQSLFTGIKIAVKDDAWYEEYHRTFKNKPKKKYIGIDVGVVHDYTVLTCMDDSGVVVDMDRFNMVKEGYSSREFKDRIAKFLVKHDKELVAAYMEVNNKAELYDELVYEYKLTKLWDIVTSASNKPEMVNVLVKMFDDCKISIPENLQLEKELYAFTAVQNKITNKWQYKGGDNEHDDCVMSLVFAAFCRFVESFSGVTEVY